MRDSALETELREYLTAAPPVLLDNEEMKHDEGVEGTESKDDTLKSNRFSGNSLKDKNFGVDMNEVHTFDSEVDEELELLFNVVVYLYFYTIS